MLNIFKTQQVAKLTLNMNSINIWTDGSCLNNGTVDASCGIGIFYNVKSSSNVSTCLPPGKQTNNRAELCAILYALCTNSGLQNITILTDSDYSIKCITQYRSKWELNGWKTSQGRPVEWSNIIRYICLLIDLRLEKGSKTTFKHVRGHSGDFGNEHADKLAQAAVFNGNISGIVSFLNEKCNVPFS